MNIKKTSLAIILLLCQDAYPLRQTPYSYRHAPLFGGSVIYNSSDFGEVSSGESYDSSLESEFYEDDTDGTFEYSDLPYVQQRVFRLRHYDTMPKNEDQNFKTAVTNAWANAFRESNEREVEFRSDVAIKDIGFVEKYQDFLSAVRRITMNKIKSFYLNFNICSVHDRTKCDGRHCVIHNPSNHHMLDWPIHFREDKYLMERICEHGIGHPDPDDLAFQFNYLKRDKEISIHGCDGCCNILKYSQKEKDNAKKTIVVKSIKVPNEEGKAVQVFAKDGDIYFAKKVKHTFNIGETVELIYNESDFKGKKYRWIEKVLGSKSPSVAVNQTKSSDAESYKRMNLLNNVVKLVELELAHPQINVKKKLVDEYPFLVKFLDPDTDMEKLKVELLAEKLRELPECESEITVAGDSDDNDKVPF